eukprot:2563742-Rhodomonas_salina.1
MQTSRQHPETGGTRATTNRKAYLKTLGGVGSDDKWVGLLLASLATPSVSARHRMQSASAGIRYHRPLS